jgi:hypothetical protein
VIAHLEADVAKLRAVLVIVVEGPVQGDGVSRYAVYFTTGGHLTCFCNAVFERA